MHRTSVGGSLIGNIVDTQEILDLCVAHGIGPEAEGMSIDRVDDADDRVEKGDVRFRHGNRDGRPQIGLEG